MTYSTQNFSRIIMPFKILLCTAFHHFYFYWWNLTTGAFYHSDVGYWLHSSYLSKCHINVYIYDGVISPRWASCCTIQLWLPLCGWVWLHATFTNRWRARPSAMKSWTNLHHRRGLCWGMIPPLFHYNRCKSNAVGLYFLRWTRQLHMLAPSNGSIR